MTSETITIAARITDGVKTYGEGGAAVQGRQPDVEALPEAQCTQGALFPGLHGTPIVVTFAEPFVCASNGVENATNERHE